MPKLIVFNQVTLDGYFTGPTGDMSWAHAGADDPEWKSFVAGNAQGGGVLVFGRVTYEMMASFWPTPMAAKFDPVVAKEMNDMPKVVFSRTLKEASWTNTKLVKRGLVEAISKMKSAPGKDMAILGSGTIVAQLAEAGLVDEYQLIVNPIVLGKGRTLFEGVKRAPKLKLLKSRTFKNGKVLLSYVPVV
ncbi:MAG: dihydrofolate reductase family protein [Opitutus sp.]